MLRIYAIMAVAVLIAAVGGVWLSTLYLRPDEAFAECGASQVAGGASQIGGPFELVNADRQTVTDKDVITAPTLIYFGYTFCPDVCPFDMSRNADAVDLLQGLVQRGPGPKELLGFSISSPPDQGGSVGSKRRARIGTERLELWLQSAPNFFHEFEVFQSVGRGDQVDIAHGAISGKERRFPGPGEQFYGLFRLASHKSSLGAGGERR